MKNIVLGKVEKFYILIEIKKKPKNQQTREDAFLKIFHFLSKEKQSVLKGNEKCLIFPLLSYCLYLELHRTAFRRSWYFTNNVFCRTGDSLKIKNSGFNL